MRTFTIFNHTPYHVNIIQKISRIFNFPVTDTFYIDFYKYIFYEKKNLRMKAGQSKYTPNTEKAYDTYYDTWRRFLNRFNERSIIPIVVIFGQ